MSPMRTPVLFRHVGKSVIIVPALYLTLLHYPCGRLFALVALGRNQGSLLAKAMEGDQESLRPTSPPDAAQEKRANQPTKKLREGVGPGFGCGGASHSLPSLARRLSGGP